MRSLFHLLPLTAMLMLAPVATVPFAAPAPAEAAAPSLNGTYTLDAAASDNVSQAIDRAVEKMNFVMKPIASSRLRGTNPTYQKVVIGQSGANVSITLDKHAPIVSPANGTPVDWKREDGEKFKVSTKLTGANLVQTFKAEDGQRSNTFTVSPDGKKLTMNVYITSPKLPSPLTYKLVFRRA